MEKSHVIWTEEIYPLGDKGRPKTMGINLSGRTIFDKLSARKSEHLNCRPSYELIYEIGYQLWKLPMAYRSLHL